MFTHKTHLFFDLDHTLWDYERNCEEALHEMFESLHLSKHGVPSKSELYFTFLEVNDRLWDLFDTRKITSEELRSRRFREIFAKFGITDFEICDKLNDIYLELSPNKPHLMDGALELLEFVAPKYSLHLITNGFDDIQTMKLKASGIEHYFETITTSQKANARKPEIEIFNFALNQAKAPVATSLMIGDNINADIAGAINAGMDFVFYNPLKITFNQPIQLEIEHLLTEKFIKEINGK